MFYLAYLGRGWLARDDQGCSAGGSCCLDLVLRGLCYGKVLNRDTMRGDVVDLAGSGHINQIIGLNFNLVARRQEGVEAHDEVWMALEELGDSADHTWCINADNTRTVHL